MALQYVSMKTIGSMLARNHKGLNFEDGDIVEWSGECIEEIGCFESFESTYDEEIRIRNNRIELPCHVHRLLAVRINKTTPNYTFDNMWVTLPDYNSGVARIDYIGVKKDAEGYPMIDKASRQACYWYCYKRLKMDDYVSGKITRHAWDIIDNELNKYIDQARSSFTNKSRDDMNRLMKILFNMSLRPQMDTSAIK